MPDFAVSTTFKGRDKLTRTLDKMGRSADKFGSKLTGSILKANAVSKGFDLLRQGTSAVASQFVQFDDAITASSAKFSDMNLATVEGQKKLLELKKTARDVGAATQFSATEAAQGLDFLAMAGFNTEQAMSSLPGVVDLATVANVDLARATDIASDSLGAFNLMTDDSVQLQTNLTRINDVMAKTMTRTNTGLEELFEAAKKGGPAFTAAGQSIESFNALLGVMANSGVKGEEAGTQLRNVMLRLAKPTGEAQKVIDKLGVSVQDQNGNFRDVMDILGDFEKGLKGMGDQQKSAALSTVFGARAITGVNILLAEGADKLKSFRKELINSSGSSKDMADIMRKSLGNRLKSLQSALIETGFKFFTAFEKQGAGAIDKITEAIRNFNMKPIIDGAKNTVKFFTEAYKIIKPFIPLIKELTIAFIAYSVAMKAFMAVGVIVNFIKFVSVIRQAIAAQGLLNVVMSANPIGLIVIGVSALIGVIVLLYRNWDKVVSIFGPGISKIWNWFSGLLDNPFFAAISTIFLPFITIPALIIKHWAPIKEMFSSIGDKFSSVASSVGGFFGIGDDDGGKDNAKTREAPNQTEIEARQQIGFAGKLQIAGAPDGSKVESKTTGAPAINVEMLGQNI